MLILTELLGDLRDHLFRSGLFGRPVATRRQILLRCQRVQRCQIYRKRYSLIRLYFLQVRLFQLLFRLVCPFFLQAMLGDEARGDDVKRDCGVWVGHFVGNLAVSRLVLVLMSFFDNIQVLRSLLLLLHVDWEASAGELKAGSAGRVLLICGDSLVLLTARCVRGHTALAFWAWHSFDGYGHQIVAQSRTGTRCRVKTGMCLKNGTARA